jgi:integrase/recombinase XerC
MGYDLPSEAPGERRSSTGKMGGEAAGAAVSLVPVVLLEDGDAHHQVAALTVTSPWSRVLASYLAAAIDSPNTRDAYARHITAALRFLGRESLGLLSGAQLASYRVVLLADSRGPASHAQALAALRSFFRWSGLYGAHQVPGDVVREALRTPRGSNGVGRPYQVLADPEAAALFAAAETLRDRAILAVLFGAGLRVAELVALDVGDLLVDVAGGAALYVRHGKGARNRVVPIRSDTERHLLLYLEEGGRTLRDVGPIFRAHDRGAEQRGRGRLTPRAVQYLMGTLRQRAAIAGKAVSPHGLRHTFAVRSLRASKDLVALRKLLGHASIATTQRYVDHLELADLRAAVAALPG